MNLHPLVDLPLLPLRVTARAVDLLQLPPNWAGSVRGAFGRALGGLVCVHRERVECAGCPEAPACVYPYLFETQAAEAQAGASGFRDLPRPYVFRSELGEKLVVPGDSLVWHVTLIGRALESLPYFVLAWRTMGQEGIGRGRGRFELSRVESLSLEGTPVETLYDRATNRLGPPSALLRLEENRSPDGKGAVPALESVEVRFLTPTSLKFQGRPAPLPHFHVLWRSLQLRLSMLRLAHGAGRPEVDFRESIQASEGVRLEAWTVQELAWNRYSQRQGRRVPMRGFVGAARYAGEIAPFLPALKLGTLVGVGDNCTFGQGHYQLVMDPATSGG
jgi:hypothetical protein